MPGVVYIIVIGGISDFQFQYFNGKRGKVQNQTWPCTYISNHLLQENISYCADTQQPRHTKLNHCESYITLYLTSIDHKILKTNSKLRILHKKFQPILILFTTLTFVTSKMINYYT